MVRLPLVGAFCIIALAPAACGDGGGVPEAETCGDFNSLSSTDQAAVGEELLGRADERVITVNPDPNAFAGELSKACTGNEDDELESMATTLMTLAESQGLNEYDDPLP